MIHPRVINLKSHRHCPPRNYEFCFFYKCMNLRCSFQSIALRSLLRGSARLEKYRNQTDRKLYYCFERVCNTHQADDLSYGKYVKLSAEFVNVPILRVIYGVGEFYVRSKNIRRRALTP